MSADYSAGLPRRRGRVGGWGRLGTSFQTLRCCRTPTPTLAGNPASERRVSVVLEPFPFSFRPSFLPSLSFSFLLAFSLSFPLSYLLPVLPSCSPSLLWLSFLPAPLPFPCVFSVLGPEGQGKLGAIIAPPTENQNLPWDALASCLPSGPRSLPRLLCLLRQLLSPSR